VRLSKGPYKFDCFVGVVGKLLRANTVPFQVRAVYGNFNEEEGNVNPFKVDLSAAPPHMPSRAWVDGALLQALMLTLWLQHWR
jgi:hypothetical protein